MRRSRCAVASGSVLAQNWLGDLAQITGYFPAVLIIFFIALLPGFLNVHIITSVVLDHPPNLRLDLTFPKISLLVAAYNEEENIADTIRGIKNQDYPGPIEIVIVDDGSMDNTVRSSSFLQHAKFEDRSGEPRR